MFGSIGLALGALSTVSSLIDSTVSSIGQAAKDAPAQPSARDLRPSPRQALPARISTPVRRSRNSTSTRMRICWRCRSSRPPSRPRSPPLAATAAPAV